MCSFFTTDGSTAYVLELLADKYKIDHSLVAQTTADLMLPPGRFTLLPGISNSVIVDSSYNSDPQSMDSLLDIIEEVIEESNRVKDTQLLSSQTDTRTIEVPKHYMIFGEMRELGDTSTLAHQEILQRIIDLGKNKGSYIENIYLVGKEWLKCDDDGVVKVQDNVSFISYKNQLFKVFVKAGELKTLLNNDTVRPNSWFWLKGSQNTIFLEIIAQHLLEHSEDAKHLARRGKAWDKIRAAWS
jgi:UDP-N-acetylmuramyl pentapeptide synthase